MYIIRSLTINFANQQKKWLISCIKFLFQWILLFHFFFLAKNRVLNHMGEQLIWPIFMCRTATIQNGKMYFVCHQPITRRARQRKHRTSNSCAAMSENCWFRRKILKTWLCGWTPWRVCAKIAEIIVRWVVFLLFEKRN